MYPPCEAFKQEFLQVSDIHTLYIEQCGNPSGKPIIFIHGGPGGSISPSDRQYFCPKTYRAILFDQRGAGKSTPTADLRENTTWDLVDDLEKIRVHLGIERWILFGGSWGSTLSLVYAETYPERVKALILRGIFMVRSSELKFLYQEGASHIFADYWQGFIAPIPVSERHDLIVAYHKYLTGDDEEKKLECAKAWSKWECAISKLIPDPEKIASAEKGKWIIEFARIENHFFFNKGFFSTDSYILDNIDKISHIPGHIIQGRYDVVCPMKSAWELHKSWPSSTLEILPTCGHSASEKEISIKLVEAADKFRDL